MPGPHSSGLSSPHPPPDGGDTRRPLTKGEKRRAKAERLARLDLLAKAPGHPSSEVDHLLRLISLTPYTAQGRLRRRLAEVAAEHGLPLPPTLPEQAQSRSLAWAQQMDPRNEDGAALHDAWLLLIEHLAYSGARTLPDHLERLRRSLESEWRRRRGLASVPAGYFIWPRTDAPLGPNRLGPVAAPPRGMLAALGYHVGLTHDLPAPTRLFLLDQAFLMHLPLVHSVAYTEEWDDPGTPGRLKKLADAIASNVRNARRKRRAQMGQACADWEHDLAYLREAYYVRHFGFGWPSPE